MRQASVRMLAQRGAVVDDSIMLRAWLPSLALLCACTTSGAATEGTTPPTTSEAASMTAEGSAGESALAPEVVSAATGTDTVFKMKIRVDGDGTVVKQSTYHRNEAAIPQAVLDLAEQKFPGAKKTHFETEVYADLGVIYEVEVDNGGTECEVAAREDGTEVYTECHLDPATLSDAIKATIESVAPGGKVLEAESKKGPDVPEEFSIEVEHDGKELYLRIAADGSLVQAMRMVPAVVEVPLK